MHKYSHGQLESDSKHITSEDFAQKKQRVVLKLGSSLLTGGNNEIDYSYLEMIAQKVASEPSTDMIIVSSGSVAAGFKSIGHTTPPTRAEDRKAAAAVGQGHLIGLWGNAFRQVNLEVAQILLTNDCFTNRKRYVSARNVLEKLIQVGIIPIINENDTVTDDKTVVGDNDNLAAMAAALVNADLLALLTDVPGVLDGKPDEEGGTKVIPTAENAEELRKLVFGKTAPGARGGMPTKLEAAERAGRYGIPTVIASGSDPEVLAAVVRGKPAGTFIAANKNPLRARRHWMAVQKGLTGFIVIDDGAVRAIKKRANLLPSGVVNVKGHFRRGDLIGVLDKAGTEQARGIVRFDDREMIRILGMHTDEVKTTLGHQKGHVVMRPDWAVLAGEEGKP
ncbi:MAG: glutamate 5-kinase [Gemmatimonadetes bacterium]|nr:glutamate 5-kinase [Gemmatimonadota bacterium]|tara:strand:- start:24424 stop:25599 length:1176 start_codon:yes stop_codon:yes gene_type:complete